MNPHALKLMASLAWTELRNHRIFALSFIASMSLGLTGFLTIDAFQRSFAQHIDGRSKSILAADLAVTASRPISEAEQQALSSALPAGSAIRRETGMFSMISVDTRSRLVEIRGIDAGFPFYGSLRLRQAGVLSPEQGRESIERLTKEHLVWIYPELLVQLGVRIGDHVQIGHKQFIIADVLDEDPSQSSVGFAIAPKVFIGRNWIEETGLVSKGSRVFHGQYIKLPNSITAAPDHQAQIEFIEKTLKQAIPAKEVRIRTHRAASEDMARLLIYLSDYLGLISLVALFFAAVGAAYLFRAHLHKRLKDIAILLSLGAAPQLARGVYIVQLLILGVTASLTAIFLSILIIPGLLSLLRDFLPANFLGSQGLKGLLQADSMLVALLLGVFGSFLFCWPILTRLRQLKPGLLFQEAIDPQIDFSPKQSLQWLPAVLVYWLLAVWQVHSWFMGSVFVGLFIGAALALAFIAWLLLSFAERHAINRSAKNASFSLWLALLSLTRVRSASLAAFTAISLAALLVSLVPLVEHSLSSELAEHPEEKRPSLFLFDIQDEQIATLKTALREQGIDLLGASPMIRAQLETVNGKPLARAEKDSTRESEDSAQAQNRGYNLSYREQLSSSETLVAGRVFSGTYDWSSGKPAEVSLEERFAKRLGVKIGDRLAFDVQGIKLDTEVVSLRRIRWTSFQPNFFVQLQTGTLDDAPKTWVAALGGLSFEQKTSAQTAIVSAFPNISIIDVAPTVKRILDIVRQMSLAIGFMAILSLLAGLMVLFAIARHRADQRIFDMALLKTLGTSFASIRHTAALEFALLGGFAAAWGALLSIIVGVILTRVVFGRPLELSSIGAWRIPIITVFLVSLLCIVAGLLASRTSLRRRPVELIGRGNF